MAGRAAPGIPGIRRPRAGLVFLKVLSQSPLGATAKPRHLHPKTLASGSTSPRNNREAMRPRLFSG